MNFVNFIYHMIQFSFIHNGEKIEGNKTKLNPDKLFHNVGWDDFIIWNNMELRKVWIQE